MNGNTRKGVISQGIKTPVIQSGDDLKNIVINSVLNSGNQFEDGDIIGVTEAVVAISQANFVTHKQIGEDITRKFQGASEIVIVDPIQSRNRFMDVLKAVAAVPTIKRVYIAMTYPTDEVGNRFVDDITLMRSGINPYKDILTAKEFYEKFGEPKHPFTGKNYIEEYSNACEIDEASETIKKAFVVLCNDFTQLPTYCNCKDFLVCSIHRRAQTKEILKSSGAERVYDLSEIMTESIDGSGYNDKYGLYGSNLMSGNRLKLMPRDCQEFVESIQKTVEERFGKHIEVFVYGDGAFKDPVGGIWELADPTTTLGATSGLLGTPKEVKLKFLASANEGKTAEEIEAIVAAESAKRKNTEDVTGDSSLGTTPRRITDLLASLADLTTGSGDRQTPVVLVKNYL
jgi:F420-0:gamma-glutamyl ligase